MSRPCTSAASAPGWSGRSRGTARAGPSPPCTRPPRRAPGCPRTPARARRRAPSARSTGATGSGCAAWTSSATSAACPTRTR
ncbi:MAG: hypothetical protein ACK56F_09320, partial [bacterium]